MDSGIVEGFQNLHVLPDSVNVDSLALDLAVALDESSPRLLRKQSCRGIDVPGVAGQPNATRPVRKRRFKKRKSAMPMSVSGNSGGVHIAAVNVSDGLDSSTSDSPARLDYMDTVARLSDSDDMMPNRGGGPGMLRISVPSSVQFAESDSVTENCTPLKPQRRRKHFRRMAIDVPETALCYRGSDSVKDLELVDVACALPPRTLDAYHGKRKRGVKEKTDASTCDHDVRDYNTRSNNKIIDTVLSSSVSSDESVIDANSNDDAIDGDDEQSDFYCEPDYPCAGGLMAASMISGARSRWKADHYQHIPSDSQLARLHYDVCSQISPSLRNSYKTRCKILFGREFHSGRRRIKDRAPPPYSYSCFLQDRHGWSSSSIQRHAGAWSQLMPSNVCTSTDGGGGKRHRMMGAAEQLTDAVEKHVATASAESARLTSSRVPAASFLSDGSVATLSTSGTVQYSWRKAVNSGLHSTQDGTNFDLLS